MILLSSLWEPFGLRSSPFFQDELSVIEADHPVTLFVGREEERRRVARRLISDPKSRTIIEGDPGVGKTSFVNRIKADAAEKNLLVYAHPIRITSDTTRQSFLADTLRTLLRMRPPSDRDPDSFWTRTARLLEGEEITGASASLFGVGGGISRGYIAPQAPPDSLFEHLGEALRRICEDAGAPALLHVDNLENLSTEGMEATARLLLDLRDYLQLRGAHWIFAGASGIDEGVFRVYTQVSGIFPEAESLLPLTPPEIARLLALRYEHLALPGQTPLPPVEPEDGALLYTLYAGDLRNFLRLLSDGAERILGLEAVRPMTASQVLRATRSLYAESLRKHLGENDFVHLAKLVAAFGGTGIPEFRVADAKEILGVTQGGASQIARRLQEAHVIMVTRHAGKSVYYRPSGPALVALGIAPAEP